MSLDFTLASEPHATAPMGRYGRFLLVWSTLSALGGVLLLLALCLFVTGSVMARWLFDAPLAGDVEITQMTCALAIAACLPYAQMKNAHVIVDFFTQNLRARTRARMDTVAALILALIAAGLAWRSVVGVMDTRRMEEISMVLGWPMWWAQLTIAPGFGLLCLTALYTANQQWRAACHLPQDCKDVLQTDAGGLRTAVA